MQVLRVSQAQVVEVFAETPQLQLVEKLAAFPQGLTVLLTQTSGSLGTAREVQFSAGMLTCPLVYNFLVRRRSTVEARSCSSSSSR